MLVVFPLIFVVDTRIIYVFYQREVSYLNYLATIEVCRKMLT